MARSPGVGADRALRTPIEYNHKTKEINTNIENLQVSYHEKELCDVYKIMINTSDIPLRRRGTALLPGRWDHGFEINTSVSFVSFLIHYPKNKTVNVFKNKSDDDENILQAPHLRQGLQTPQLR